MNKIKMAVVSVVAVFTIMASLFSAGLVSTTNAPPTPKLFSFTVKFSCNIPVPNSDTTVVVNELEPKFAEFIGLPPGEYETEINVYNPSFSQNVSVLLKRFIFSAPEPKTPPFFVSSGLQLFAHSVIVGPGAAFSIDCREILGLLNPFRTTGQGYAVLVADSTDLDVTAEHAGETFASPLAESRCLLEPSQGPIFTIPSCVSTGHSLAIEHIQAVPFLGPLPTGTP